VSKAPLYLLDTNILVHYVRGSPLWYSIIQRYQLLLIDPIPILSVVTEGEVRSLARRRNWGESKTDQLEFILGYFRRQSLDDAVLLDFYATLDSYCEWIGHSMGKNDLWIASTACAYDATLLTTDRDFDRLSPQFLTREWIDPNTP
jgi:tRNA(fMet)-specific endonuclease VapC